jgi:hypothetical protein
MKSKIKQYIHAGQMQTMDAGQAEIYNKAACNRIQAF